MRKIKIRHWISILLLPLAAFYSCNVEEISRGGDTPLPEGITRLTATVGTGLKTRAVGDPLNDATDDEKRIDRVAFFVHTEAEGMQVYEPAKAGETHADFPNKVQLEATTPGDPSGGYTATVDLTTGAGYDADIIAVANLPEDYDYSQIVSWQGLLDSVAVGTFTPSMPLCTGNDGAGHDNAFVMCGSTTVALHKEKEETFNLALERLTARIDITNEAYVQGMTAADPKGGFLLTSVRMLQARPASYITPQPGYTSPDVATISDWQVTDIPYGKATALDADANPTREPDAVDATAAETDATLQYLWRTLYTYENSDTEHAPTALEIKGAFRGTEVTRRIDFIDTDKKPVPLVRNHRYLVRILPAPGQTDITFDIKVSEWDAVDTVNVKPDQTAVPEITNIGGNVTPNRTNEIAKTYDVYYTQDGELTFDATCPFAPGVRVKYYDPHTDSWTTKGDWLKVKQVGSTEIVTKADHTYKNSFQVTFNKFEGGVTRKAMLLVHNGGSEVECDTILLRHVITYPGTDFEPEAVAKRDDKSDIIVAPVNVGATKEPSETLYMSSKPSEELWQNRYEQDGYFFQWGRKTGQKYIGGYDMEYVIGPIPTNEANSEENQNMIIKVEDPEMGTWSIDSDPFLWNAGTEDNPVKSKNDPCPPGWRIITQKELDKIKDKMVSEEISHNRWHASIKDSNIKLTPAGVLLGGASFAYIMNQYQGVVFWFSSLSKSATEMGCAVSARSYEDTPWGKAMAAPVRCIQEQTPSL